MQEGQVSIEKQDNSLPGRSCPEDGGVHPRHSFIAAGKIILSPVSAPCSVWLLVCWPSALRQEAFTGTPTPWGFPPLSPSLSCLRYLEVQDKGTALSPYFLLLGCLSSACCTCRSQHMPQIRHLQPGNSRKISVMGMQPCLTMHFDTRDESFHCLLIFPHL